MQATIPLIDAGIGELIARVAYQMIRRHSRIALAPGELPGKSFWASLHGEIPQGLVVLDAFIYAYETSSRKGVRTVQAREIFIQRSRVGYAWRRCVEPAYKENRRKVHAPPPPLTGGCRNHLT